MATEAEPSGQLIAPNTENICKSESSMGPAVTTDKPPNKKPVILTNCELCNVVLTSQSIVDAHMASKKHKKKMLAAESMKSAFGQKKVAAANSPLYRCDICNVTLNSFQQKEFHLAGMKHNYKVKKNAEANEMFQGKETISIPNPPIKMEEATASIGSTAAAGAGAMTTETESSMPVQQDDLRCTVCHITVNSVQQLTQHLSSKKHQLKENNLKRSTPYDRPRRGGPGRGAAGGPGGRGRGQWGGRSKSVGVNSLNSNFQSAGFATNFQTSVGNQSLKRDRSPRNTSFGNGNNDDFSNQSYRGGKIPRSSQSAPFSSQDPMDHNSFTSANNAFGGGNSSFGGKNNSFGGGNSSFGRGNNSFGGGKTSFGGGKTSFGRGNKSFGEGNNSFGGGNNSFGGGKNSFGGASSSFGGGNSSFGGGNGSFGGDNNSFGDGSTSFGAGKSSFDRGNSFEDANNSFHAGFGRGKMRGGPQRGNSLKRGHGFGNRGSFGNPA